jgi:hypothetical protein
MVVDDSHSRRRSDSDEAGHDQPASGLRRCGEQAAYAADALCKEPGVEVEVVDGGHGEPTALVDG